MRYSLCTRRVKADGNIEFIGRCFISIWGKRVFPIANRRMFSLDVVDTDLFLDMPVSTQCLYFHLGMRADDDGFVNSPKKITSMTGCKTDDLRILISKGFLLPFENGVVVIRHWKPNRAGSGLP